MPNKYPEGFHLSSTTMKMEWPFRSSGVPYCPVHRLQYAQVLRGVGCIQRGFLQPYLPLSRPLETWGRAGPAYATGIANLWWQWPALWRGKIRVALTENGIRISRKWAPSIMYELNLCSARTNSKKEFQKRQKYAKQKLLQQNFKADHSNQIWANGITCFKINGDWLFFVWSLTCTFGV